MAQWSRDPRCAVNEDTLKARITRDGWEPELAISAPTRFRRFERQCVCHNCGKEYISKQPEAALPGNNSYCSDRCRMRVGSDNRRARNALAFVEEVNRLEVFASYGGECYLCWKPLDPNDWDLEHIIPISRGGLHCRDNVAPSHHICNLRKGTKSYIEYMQDNLPVFP